MLNKFKEFVVTKWQARILHNRVLPLIERQLGRSKFYPLAKIQSLIESEPLLQKYNRFVFACFCYESDFNQLFGLKPKNSDYRSIRLKYGFNAKQKRKRALSKSSSNDGSIDYGGSDSGGGCD